MAKARDIPLEGLSFREAAARIVEVRAREVFEHSEGVLDLEDIERVHAMRVATRRLRAAMEICRPCFPKGEFKGLLGEVKDLADVLGERRDPDVAVDFFRDLTDAGPLVEDLERERLEANERLGAKLEEIEQNDLRGRLEALALAAV
ncbi:MAG: CHAD domain-containing protein [Thermoleophilaceae bacterium]|nr:CHAD domain-containing protein [Thermoleophilaceae bacterium]